MLWPLVLPLKITFWCFAWLVATVTLLAPLFKWKRGTAFLASFVLAAVAFIPSCTAVMSVIDQRRFGAFHYTSFAEVNDLRVERYLPPQASDITLDKYAMGHRAKYSISEADLRAYVDGLWRRYGEYSAIPRDELDDGATVKYEEFRHWFAGLDWPPIELAIVCRSPVERDGGGATYYFDPEAGVAYHHAGYW